MDPLVKRVADRHTARGDGISWYQAAKADNLVGEAYNNLVGMKMEMDRFEEIPNGLMPLYKAIMKAMGAVGDARQETTQVRGIVSRVSRRY